MVLEEQICPTLILGQKTQTARKGRRKKSENLSNVSDDGAKFYDEDTGKYINLEALFPQAYPEVTELIRLFP